MWVNEKSAGKRAGFSRHLRNDLESISKSLITTKTHQSIQPIQNLILKRKTRDSDSGDSDYLENIDENGNGNVKSVSKVDNSHKLRVKEKDELKPSQIPSEFSFKQTNEINHQKQNNTLQPIISNKN